MEDNKLVLILIVCAIIGGLGYWKKSSNDEKKLEKERIALEVEKAKLEKEKAELAKNNNSQQQVKESPEQQIARLKQAQQSNNQTIVEQQPKTSVKEKSDTDVPKAMLISYTKERFHSGVVLRSLESFYQGNMSILCGEAMLDKGWRGFALVHTSNRETGRANIELNVNHDVLSTDFQDNVRSVYCHN